MTPTRVIVFSLLGFVAPVAISLSLSALLYSHTPSARMQQQPTTAPANDIRTEFEERTTSSVSVPSRVNLDPALNHDFLVSFVISLDRLPGEGQRQHLVGKYTNRAPYEGWAVGLRRLSTSLRPEVYWRGSDGTGGWMSFDSVGVKPNTAYVFTVVARPEQYLALFYQEVNRVADGTFEVVGKSNFAGAHELIGVRTPKTDAPLNVGIRLPKSDRFPGEISRLVVSYPANLPRKFDQLDELISGGPGAIESNLEKQEINFSLGEEGRRVSLLSFWG